MSNSLLSMRSTYIFDSPLAFALAAAAAIAADLADEEAIKVAGAAAAGAAAARPQPLLGCLAPLAHAAHYRVCINFWS